jgi:Cytochrome P450
MGAFTNIVAGADTSWVSLNGILYHLIKNPESLRKLRKEIDDMSSKGVLSNPAKFGEAQRMLYLQAVIKEGIRVYPATGFPLWRTVPEPGVTLCGNFFPPGVSSASASNVLWCTVYKLIRLLNLDDCGRQYLGSPSQPHSIRSRPRHLPSRTLARF